MNDDRSEIVELVAIDLAREALLIDGGPAGVEQWTHELLPSVRNHYRRGAERIVRTIEERLGRPL